MAKIRFYREIKELGIMTLNKNQLVVSPTSTQSFCQLNILGIKLENNISIGSSFKGKML